MKIDVLGGYGNEIRQTKVAPDNKHESDFDKSTGIESLKLREKNSNRNYVDDAIKKLKDAGDVFNRRLDFRVDDATKRIVVKVIDTKTDKVIKEIPPEQLIRLAARIQEMIGLLVDEER